MCIFGAVRSRIAAIEAVPRRVSMQTIPRRWPFSLRSIVRSRKAQPVCESKIRAVADALGFCFTHDCDYEDLGYTTGATAAQFVSEATVYITVHHQLNQ